MFLQLKQLEMLTCKLHLTETITIAALYVNFLIGFHIHLKV